MHACPALSLLLSLVITHRIPLCLVIGSVFYVIWTCGYLIAPDPLAYAGYEVSILLLIAAVLIEMTAEPLFIYAQLKSRFTVRIVAETASLLVRCLFLLAFVLIKSKQQSKQPQQQQLDDAAADAEGGSNILLAFSVGQVAGSICYSLIFWCYFCAQEDFDARLFIPSFASVSVEQEEGRRRRTRARLPCMHK